MLKTWESGNNYFVAEPRSMRVWVVPRGFVMILTPLSSLSPLDMYPVEPQSTRGGVLLVDIAFNRPTAQNLHVRGLVWCRATRGDGQGWGRSIQILNMAILSKHINQVGPDFISQFWVEQVVLFCFCFGSLLQHGRAYFWGMNTILV